MREQKNGGDVHRRLAWTLLGAMLVVLSMLQAVGVMNWTLFDVVVAGGAPGRRRLYGLAEQEVHGGPPTVPRLA